MKIGKKIQSHPKNSIALEEMRLSVPEQNPIKAWAFYYALLVLGIGASLGFFYSAFEIPVSVTAIVLCLLLFGALFTAMFLMKRKNTWFVVGAMGVVTLLILVFKNAFYRGILVTVKYILDQFRAHGSGIAFPNSLRQELRGANEKLDATLFIICLVYILAILVSWLLIKRRNFFLAGFITLPFVLAPIFVPINPPLVWAILLLMYYFTLMFLSPALSGNRMFRRGFRGYHISSNAAANPAAFVILPVLLVCVIIVSIIFPQSAFQRSAFLEAIRATFVNGFDSSDFSRYMNATFGGDLSAVDLDSVGNISFNNLPVLGLTMNGDYYYMDSPNEMGANHTEYLKGYVGSVYSEEGWTSLSDEKAQEVARIFGYSDHAQNIYSDIKAEYRNNRETRDYYEMSIKYIRGDPRRVYIPYGLTEIGQMSELEYVDDSHMVAKNSEMGIDNYHFTAYSVFENNANMSLSERLQWYYNSITGYMTDSYPYKAYVTEDGSYYGYGYFGVDDDGYIYFIDDNGGYYSRIERYDPSKDYGDLFDNSPNIDDIDESMTYDEVYSRLSKYLTSYQMGYIDTLKEYEDFTNETYTQLPDTSREMLREFISENNIRTDTMENSISDVVNVLKNSGSFEYTLTPGKASNDTDFAEYFLFENKKGYCRHFATAATLLLREAGVPARYVEGYSFESTDFINTGYIELLDSDAHAWVEVYYSGTGWVPIEVTPSSGNGGAVSNAESSESSDESSAESSEPSESSDESSAASEPSETESGESSAEASGAAESDISNSASPIVYILFVPVCVAVIYGILALNRFVRMKKRRKGFDDRNINSAALAYYGYIAKLLMYRTPTKDNITEYERIAELAEDENLSPKHREWCMRFCEELYPIAEKAKFSGRIISPDELRMLSESANAIRSDMMDELNLPQKFAALYFDII